MPPFIPPSPLPVSLIVEPLSTPAGIRTFTRSFTRVLVVPWQTEQYFSGTLPSPLQLSQTLEVATCPNIVFLTDLTSPVPLQVAQETIDDPGSAPLPLQCAHTSDFAISNSFSEPNTASEKDI